MLFLSENVTVLNSNKEESCAEVVECFGGNEFSIFETVKKENRNSPEFFYHTSKSSSFGYRV